MPNIPVLAVDAGGTSCRAALYGLDGTVIASAQGGPSNYQSIGTTEVLHVFESTFQTLIEHLETPLHVQCAVIGVAGLDTSHDRIILQKLLKTALEQSHIVTETLILENDALITLMGHIGKDPGVLIVSGTGSIVCGQANDGRQIRAGGWGHQVGDEGSGYAIGSAALRHVFRALDGRDFPSQIPNGVLKALSLESTEDLLTWMYNKEYSVSAVASLTKTVCELAQQGDAMAHHILSEAASSLVDTTEVVIKQLELGLSGAPFKVVLSGGVLQHCPIFIQKFLHILNLKSNSFELLGSRNEPIHSAALHALRCLGVTPAENRWENSTSKLSLKENGG